MLKILGHAKDPFEYDRLEEAHAKRIREGGREYFVTPSDKVVKVLPPHRFLKIAADAQSFDDGCYGTVMDGIELGIKVNQTKKKIDIVLAEEVE